MFRFSHDKRFRLGCSFEEFTRTATQLAEMVKTASPTASVEVLTCEDRKTHKYSQVTIIAEEVTEALKGRRSYTLEDLTKDVWDRSMSLQLTINLDPKPCMICLSLDRREEPGSMKFYGQSVEPSLQDLIIDTFARPSFFVAIGDGYPKPSSFNFEFVTRKLGFRPR